MVLDPEFTKNTKSSTMDTKGNTRCLSGVQSVNSSLSFVVFVYLFVPFVNSSSLNLKTEEDPDHGRRASRPA